MLGIPKGKHIRKVKIRKRALAAWLLWFFMGWWGVHRFYLGYFRSGLIMLAIAAYIALGFVLSLVFHLINAPYGITIGLAILAILVWYISDIFRMPGMVGRDNP